VTFARVLRKATEPADDGSGMLDASTSIDHAASGIGAAASSGSAPVDPAGDFLGMLRDAISLAAHRPLDEAGRARQAAAGASGTRTVQHVDGDLDGDGVLSPKEQAVLHLRELARMLRQEVLERSKDGTITRTEVHRLNQGATQLEQLSGDVARMISTGQEVDLGKLSERTATIVAAATQRDGAGTDQRNDGLLGRDVPETARRLRATLRTVAA
jgi:hypothetical protein